VKLGELAVRFGCELRGDPDLEVDAVAALSAAHPRALSFLANPRYRSQLRETRAGAVVVDAASAAECPVPALVTANPHACFARIAALLHPAPLEPPGTHPSAVVDATASVDPTAHVGPLCCVGPGARIGPRCVLGPGSVVDAGAVLAADVHLVARVTICRGVVLGERVVVQPGAVIGADGFGYAAEGGTWVKVPQVGSVRVGADVEIGANTTIDRGAIGDTVIEEGVKLDNQIQIGHNVTVGAHTAMAACVGVSGSTKIGRRCQIGGAVGIVGHLTICDDVAVTGYTMVSSSITEPGIYSSGLPAMPAAEWRRIVARLRRIEGMADRLRSLESRIGGGTVGGETTPGGES
jgi:UDP-3-O-[3-hydroxymyristoyl] glucosamine N-acyltransferase